jgi:hypothetical protein
MASVYIDGEEMGGGRGRGGTCRFRLRGNSDGRGSGSGRLGGSVDNYKYFFSN